VTRRLAGILIAVAGLCYSSWVLEFAWADSLDPMRSFLSELDAAHRPHREIYVVGDVTTGICALVAAALLLVPHRMFRGRMATVALLALAVFGAATVADALLPIECIPGVDAGCAREPSGILPQLHHIHALTSTVAVFAIFTVMLAAGMCALRAGTVSPVWPILRRIGNGVLIVVALATVWMLVADNLSGDYRLGLAQRIQVGGMSVWLMLWGWAVATPPSHTDRVRRNRASSSLK
jgi:hypothetical protein